MQERYEWEHDSHLLYWANDTLLLHLGPYDFRDAENADGMAESSHKMEFTV